MSTSFHRVRGLLAADDRHFLLQSWVVVVAILGVIAVLCVFALSGL